MDFLFIQSVTMNIAIILFETQIVCRLAIETSFCRVPCRQVPFSSSPCPHSMPLCSLGISPFSRFLSVGNGISNQSPGQDQMLLGSLFLGCSIGLT